MKYLLKRKHLAKTFEERPMLMKSPLLLVKFSFASVKVVRFVCTGNRSSSWLFEPSPSPSRLNSTREIEPWPRPRLCRSVADMESFSDANKLHRSPTKSCPTRRNDEKENLTNTKFTIKIRH